MTPGAHCAIASWIPMATTPTFVLLVGTGWFDTMKSVMMSSVRPSPLHFALSKGFSDSAHILLEKGADLSICDGEGKSCSQIAKEHNVKIPKLKA